MPSAVDGACEIFDDLFDAGRQPVFERWRIMGMWETGEQFLVVLGQTRAECKRLLDNAVSDYTYADFERTESLWFEAFSPGDRCHPPEWIPLAEIPMRRLRLIKAGQQRRNRVSGQPCEVDGPNVTGQALDEELDQPGHPPTEMRGI